MVLRPALPRDLPLDLVATAAKWLQSCLTLCGPIDYSPTVSVHETFQARILEWVGIYFSRGPSQYRDQPSSLTSPALLGRFLFSSVQFSSSVELSNSFWLFSTLLSNSLWMVDSLWPHALQHTRPPCPSPTPRAYSNSCPLSLWCHPAISSSVIPFSSCLQSFPASGSFPNESVLHIRWPKFWSFRFSISPSNEYSGLFSFRLDLLAVQGTLKSLLQHHNSKAPIIWHSAFFIVQHSHPYMTIGKTIALTRWTFAGKVMSLLFIMLSSLVIAFLPRTKRLFISWLQSPSAMILEPPKNSLSLFPLFPHLFAMKLWDQMPWS